MKREPGRPVWMQLYVNGISLLGLLIVLLALTDIPEDRYGLVIFIVLASVAELTNVELFQSSRSRVSVASMAAMASILVFGPLAGSLTHTAIGLTTLITTSLGKQQAGADRASGLQRTAFNTGMLVISAAVAGWTYELLGGQFGDVWQAGNLLPLLAASTVNVAANLAILIGVVALQTGQRSLETLKRDFGWAVPIAVIGGATGGGILALAYLMFNLLGVAVFFLPILATTYSYRLYINHTKGYVEKLEKMNRDLDEANVELLETLGHVIDAYDVYTAGHSRQVAVYAVAIAEKMNLSEQDQRLIYKAALVHDIGKVGVEETIISKPGKLSAEEYNIVKRHATISAEIIGQMKGFKDIVPIVLHHHERWDGQGYPDGLKGEEIPLAARIIALADALEAMLTHRPHRPPLSFKEILEEIERCSGTQFDPQVVKAFFQVVEEKERGFFKNSAALVDRAVLLSGAGSSSIDALFMKKSKLDN